MPWAKANLILQAGLQGVVWSALSLQGEEAVSNVIKLAYILKSGSSWPVSFFLARMLAKAA